MCTFLTRVHSCGHYVKTLLLPCDNAKKSKVVCGSGSEDYRGSLLSHWMRSNEAGLWKERNDPLAYKRVRKGRRGRKNWTCFLGDCSVIGRKCAARCLPTLTSEDGETS